MPDQRPLREQVADALSRAVATPNNDERPSLLEEALQLYCMTAVNDRDANAEDGGAAP